MENRNKNKNCGIYGAILCAIMFADHALGMMNESSSTSPRLEIRRSVDMPSGIERSEAIIGDVIKSTISNQIKHKLGLGDEDISCFMGFLIDSEDFEDQFCEVLISKGLSKDALNPEFFEFLANFYATIEGDLFGGNECIAIGLLVAAIATGGDMGTMKPILDQALKIASRFPTEEGTDTFRAVIIAITTTKGDVAILERALEIAGRFPPETGVGMFKAILAIAIAFGEDTATLDSILEQALEIMDRFPPEAIVDVFRSIVAGAITFKEDVALLEFIFDQFLEIANQFPPETGAYVFSNIMAAIIALEGNIEILNYMLPTALEIIRQLSLGDKRIMIEKIIMGLPGRPDIVEALDNHWDEIRYIGELDQLSARGLIECLVMGEDIYVWENIILRSVLQQIEELEKKIEEH